MSAFKGSIPQGLVDALKSNKCILFVGAGLSAGVKRSDGRPLPLWKELLEELLIWAEASRIIYDGNYCVQVGEIIQKGDLLMAAQALQSKIDVLKIGEFLSLIFGGLSPSEAHCILPQIPFKVVLTSNYDCLIEDGYAKINGAAPLVFTQKDLEAQDFGSKSGGFYIFKLHGHIGESKTIALGSRDYQNLFFKQPRYRQFLESLFLSNCVLFIGFGGNDPDIEDVLNKLSVIFSENSQCHYILLPSGTKNNVEKEMLFSTKRLEVIDYEADEGHSQVKEFLEALIF